VLAVSISYWTLFTVVGTFNICMHVVLALLLPARRYTNRYFIVSFPGEGARGSVVDCATSRKVAGSSPDEVDFFN
jgi:hypothetical protein